MGTIQGEISWMEVKEELPYAVGMDAAEDQAARRSGRHHERKASRRARLLRERKSELKNPRIRWGQEEEEEEEDWIVDEDEGDKNEMCCFRRNWELAFARSYGSFEDKTPLGPMRYTEGTIPEYACCETVVQIFSVQVTELKDGLKWPLHVYGHVAARDLMDHNRNLLFERERDNCQILSQQDSSLILTGPSRAVVIINPVTFEVDLKVKGETEAEDKLLSLKIFRYDRPAGYGSNAYVTHNRCSSKRSTLDFKLATLLDTVEATVVSAKVVGGSWLDDCQGRIVCCTASASKEDIVLLDSRDGRMPITADGEIKLSRSVVSVELTGELIFRVVASQMGDKTDVFDQGVAFFTPTVRGKSHGTCDLGFCKLEIAVAWSLFSTMEDMRLQNRI